MNKATIKGRVHCPYCGIFATLTSGLLVYPHLPYLHNEPVWECKKCRARVGCHKTTTLPLGTLANKELRTWRRRVHYSIDIWWKNDIMTRKTMYTRLRVCMGITEGACHVALFNINQCKKALQCSQNL